MINRRAVMLNTDDISALLQTISILLPQRSDDFGWFIPVLSHLSLPPSVCHLIYHLRFAARRHHALASLSIAMNSDITDSTRVPSLPAITLTHSGLLPMLNVVCFGISFATVHRFKVSEGDHNPARLLLPSGGHEAEMQHTNNLSIYHAMVKNSVWTSCK